MTDFDILKSGRTELAGLLCQKECVDLVKKNPELLDYIIETMEPERLAECLVKGKFAPTKAVARYPEEFMGKFIELDFNPGITGVLELCELSNSSSRDTLVSKVISHFRSNKYDGAFVQSVMNISLESSLHLEETLATLLENLGVGLAVLQNLVATSPARAIKVLKRLPHSMQESGASLFEDEDDLVSVAKESLEDFAFLLSNKSIQKHLTKFSQSTELLNQAARALNDDTSSSMIDDSLANMLLVALSERHHYYASSETYILYRPMMEGLFSKLQLPLQLRNVPATSPLYKTSVLSGGTEVGVAATFQIAAGSWDLKEQNMKAIFTSGEDSEVADFIRGNPEMVNQIVENSKIKPGTFANIFKRESRSLTAEALSNCLTGSYKTAIRRELKLTSPGSKIPMIERHEAVTRAISAKNVDAFWLALSGYEPELNFRNSQLKAFIDRHSQTSYRTKYELKSFSCEFLKNLNDEEFAIQLFNSKLNFRTHWGDASGSQAFLSAANTFSEGFGLSSNDQVVVCYEVEQLIMSMPLERLAEVGNLKGQAHISLAAKQFLTRWESQSKELEISCDELRATTALLFTKEEFCERFQYKAFGKYGEPDILEFKGGATLSAAELLSEGKAASSSNRALQVLDGLAKIKANAEIAEICKAILEKKAVAFKAFFPNVSQRNEELKSRASQLLASLGIDTGNPAFSPEALIAKAGNLGDLQKVFGDALFEMMMKYPQEPSKSLRVSNWFGLLANQITALMSVGHYAFHVGAIGLTKDNLSELEMILDLGIAPEKVEVDGAYHYHFSQAGDEDDIERLRMLANLVTKYPGLKWSSDLPPLSMAKHPELSLLFQAYSIDEVISEIDSIEALKQAVEMGIMLGSSSELSEKVAKNRAMLEYAISQNLQLRQVDVCIYTFEFDDIASLVEPAAGIGLNIVTEKEWETFLIVKHVFEADGSIKKFEPISLDKITVPRRLEIVRMLANKNPKYKKLLSADFSEDGFVLNPPELIGKETVGLQSLKEAVGFGIPGGLNKIQTQALADRLAVNGGLLSIAARRLRNYLDSVGLSDLEFSDLINADDPTFEPTPLCYFMAKSEMRLSEPELFFKTVMKGASKSEAIALLRSENDQFHTSWINDSTSFLKQLGSDFNKSFARMNMFDLSANDVFAAMSGDSSALEKLDGSKLEEGQAAYLKSISDAVKECVVYISIERKRARADEPSELGRVVHDRLGSLLQKIAVISQRGTIVKSGLGHLNKSLAKQDYAISGPKKGEYRLRMFEDLAESKHVGKINSWCTSYTDSYFDNMLSGKSVLFVIENGGDVVAQGNATPDRDGWTMNQLMYPGNRSARSDFSQAEIFGCLSRIIRSDESVFKRFPNAA